MDCKKCHQERFSTPIDFSACNKCHEDYHVGDFEKNGFFISNPFYELGAERLIDSLTYAASNPAVSNTEIAYRTAGENLDWEASPAY